MLLGTGLLLAACSPEPRSIEYGFDSCDFCKMTIVDQQHAAQAVTKKGKVYNFDAIECLVPFLENEGEESFAFLLAADYEAPGALTDARKSTFLISKAIPSPMGAFLSAFSEAGRARAVQAEKGGVLFDWGTLKAHLRREGMAGR